MGVEVGPPVALPGWTTARPEGFKKSYIGLGRSCISRWTTRRTFPTAVEGSGAASFYCPRVVRVGIGAFASASPLDP